MSAIIIGFQYSGDKYLHGISADINAMRNYCESIGLNSIVISDVFHQPPYLDKIFNVFTSGYPLDPLLIYYTGHAKHSCFILPDQLICMNKFRNEIIRMVPYYSRILLIMDCCNSSGFGLPYELIDDKYHYISNSSFELDKYTPAMICISASKINENSIIGSNGSIFTKELIKLLNNRVMYLPLLLRCINQECNKYYNQTATIHSTKELMVMWNWVYGEYRYDLNMMGDDIIVEIY